MQHVQTSTNIDFIAMNVIIAVMFTQQELRAFELLLFMEFIWENRIK